MILSKRMIEVFRNAFQETQIIITWYGLFTAPPQRSCRKVMFSVASVCPRVGGVPYNCYYLPQAVAAR